PRGVRIATLRRCPATETVNALIYQDSSTYRPGAASTAGYRSLPSDPGAGMRSPDRLASQSRQMSHQDPVCWRAAARHSSASDGYRVPMKQLAFGLPGGFRMLWMWPALLNANVGLPPRS